MRTKLLDKLYNLIYKVDNQNSKCSVNSEERKELFKTLISLYKEKGYCTMSEFLNRNKDYQYYLYDVEIYAVENMAKVLCRERNIYLPNIDNDLHLEIYRRSFEQIYPEYIIKEAFHDAY